MQTSDFGIKLIAAFEGFPAQGRVYRCPAGVPTQGYGHTAAAGPPALGGQWSREKAQEVLQSDLARVYEPGVRALLKRPATQGQFDALVSFAFNCGVGALAKSSVLKHHNRGDCEQAAGAFAAWVKAGGKVLPGLVRRRASEALAYQGVQDLDFDGRRDPDEPVYGPMPQAVEQAREKPGKSGTIKGAGAATVGGAIVAGNSVKEALETAQPHISAGTWIGIAIGVLILFGAGYALYRKWGDMGRPNPWR